MAKKDEIMQFIMHMQEAAKEYGFKLTGHESSHGLACDLLTLKLMRDKEVK